MHIFPVNSWFKDILDSFLGFINSDINLFLFISEFSINWECYGLISTISVPFSSHIMKSHFSWLIYFVILNVMKSGAISSTWTDWMETSFCAASFMSVFEFKDTLKLNLFESCFGWFQSRNVSLCADSTDIPHYVDLILSFDCSQIWDKNP